jgi:glycosyltransferase involved in cell wall biosynthesis
VSGLPGGLSVVVPTHDRNHLLAATLGALLADPATGELVVVLDGCSDGSAATVRGLAAADRRVHALELSPNSGPPVARLRGVEAAAGTVVLCVDDDVVVEPGCVSGHLRHHRAGDADVVVGYMPVRVPSGRWTATQRRYAVIYEEHAGRWEAEEAQVLESLWGGNVSFRRTDYLEAGSRCDLSIRFHEDQELGLVLRAMGRTGRFDRELRAAHLYERSVPAVLRDLERSGFAYGRLQARFPGDLPPWTEVLGTELRSPVRRALLRGADGPVVAAGLRGAVGLLERLAPGSMAAQALIRMLGRAQYTDGFREATGIDVRRAAASVGG